MQERVPMDSALISLGPGLESYKGLILQALTSIFQIVYHRTFIEA